MDATTLQSNSTMQLTEQQGAFIVCELGQLWLTDNGDDIVLQRGERHQIQGNAPVVIESVSTTGHFRIEGARATRTHWGQKFQHTVRDALHNRHLPHVHA